MKEFLADLPMSHWTTFIFVPVALVSLIYVIYFFFSKEGRDERGRGIFASASAITFILMIVISEIYSFHAMEWFTNGRAFIYMNMVKLTLLCICQSLCIAIFRKAR